MIAPTNENSNTTVQMNMNKQLHSMSKLNPAMKEQHEESYLKTREINQLASKFENCGIFTAETSKILAQNILTGSVDLFA